VQRNTAVATGVHRHVDQADKQVYVWTSFEPDDARRAWACFDQPDLKAVHAFTVTAPENWTVLSNTGDATVEETADGRVWTFTDTPRLSTYVVVVNGGPFHELRQERDGYSLGLYCRASLASFLDRDADELFDVTAAGLAFFGEQFGMPFPQRRYDQVWVPDMGGAMENWGCVTWGDGLIFRSTPTPTLLEARVAVLLHEMAHMWFGDIVTMRWWDDLWLNEAFADWAANWATTNATQYTDRWATFLTLQKVAGYRSDRAPTTHPIRQPVGDVAEAAAGFDNITYCKGASVLKQLVVYVGEDKFLAGLRDYFQKHEYDNASLADLMDALARASGRDLTPWVHGWLETAGTDTLHLETSDAGTSLRAEGPGDTEARPHRLGIGVYDGDGDALRRRELVSLELDGAPVALPTLDPAPRLLLVNDDDLTFAGVAPDDASLAELVLSAAALPTPLARALAVQTVWDMLATARLSAGDFVRAATGILRRETADPVIEPVQALAVQAAEMWSTDDARSELMSVVADTCLVLADGPPHRRQAAVKALARTATTDEQLSALHELSRDEVDLRWRALTRRAALGEVDQAEIDELVERDPDPDAWVRSLVVATASADGSGKQEAWDAVIRDHRVPIGALADLSAAFWQPAQAPLLTPYVDRYLAALPELSKSGMIAAMSTTATMFPVVGFRTDDVARTKEAAAAEDVSPLVRRVVLERVDTVERMLAARAG
jgi:aminopeptidase N